MVTHKNLDLVFQVRILAGQPNFLERVERMNGLRGLAYA